jgi:hypothetical protein
MFTQIGGCRELTLISVMLTKPKLLAGGSDCLPPITVKRVLRAVRYLSLRMLTILFG